MHEILLKKQIQTIEKTNNTTKKSNKQFKLKFKTKKWNRWPLC